MDKICPVYHLTGTLLPREYALVYFELRIGHLLTCLPNGCKWLWSSWFRVSLFVLPAFSVLLRNCIVGNYFFFIQTNSAELISFEDLAVSEIMQKNHKKLPTNVSVTYSNFLSPPSLVLLWLWQPPWRKELGQFTQWIRDRIGNRIEPRVILSPPLCARACKITHCWPSMSTSPIKGSPRCYFWEHLIPKSSPGRAVTEAIFNSMCKRK